MGKRGNNEGSIYKRTDDRWEARIVLSYKLDGKPRYQTTYHRTKKEAQQHLQGAIYRLSNGLSLLDNTTTVSLFGQNEAEGYQDHPYSNAHQ